MARYVDGFVIPVPRKNVRKYLEIARQAGKVWKQHGALEYVEAVGEDLRARWGFRKMAKSKANETVVFSFIVYRSRAHRDAVNKKVMKDKRIAAMMEPNAMPFDVRRMAYGGFQIAVDL
jgi:uncharacterized protein YbaA (DUF1428 family)